MLSSLLILAYSLHFWYSQSPEFWSGQWIWLNKIFHTAYSRSLIFRDYMWRVLWLSCQWQHINKYTFVSSKSNLKQTIYQSFANKANYRQQDIKSITAQYLFYAWYLTLHISYWPHTWSVWGNIGRVLFLRVYGPSHWRDTRKKRTRPIFPHTDPVWSQ